MNSLLVDLRNLPEEGLHREGTLPVSFFALQASDPVRPTSPLTYSLDIERDGKELLVQGSVQATFNLECGRCTERFGYALDLPDYVLEVPIENALTIDLTEPLREDILLALPSYPRCEDGNITPRACPAEGRFAEPVSAEPPPHEDKGIWDALDKLNR
jgi:uncharacterized protein